MSDDVDPGPLARFAAVVARPETPLEIVQRLTGGESLKEIAKSWGLPPKKLLAWVAANGELSDQCRRVRELAGVELRMEGLEIVDDISGEIEPAAVAAAKLRAEYRERLSRDLNKPLFGKQVKHEHTHTVDLGDRLRRAMSRGRVIEQVSEAVTLGSGSSSEVAPDPSPALVGAI